MSDSDEDETIRLVRASPAGAVVYLPRWALFQAERAALLAEDVRRLGMVVDPERVAGCDQLAALIGVLEAAWRASLVQQVAQDGAYRLHFLSTLEEMALENPNLMPTYMEIAEVIASHELALEEAPPAPQPSVDTIVLGILRKLEGTETPPAPQASLGPRHRPAPQARRRSEFDRLLELKGTIAQRAGRDPARLHIAGTIRRRRTIHTVKGFLRDLERDPERAAEWAVAQQLMDGLWPLLD